MPAIRAVIFDCYGTLVDILTDEGKDAIFNHLSLYLRYYGASLSAPALKSIYYTEKDRYMNTRGERYPEFNMSEVMAAILRKEGLHNPFLIESCCKIFRLVSRDRFQLYPDSLPALKEIRSLHLPMAMLSNAQAVFFHEEIDMLGIKQYFKYFVVSSYWGFRKPDPRLFALSCDICGVKPFEAVYIGDDYEVDVKGAAAIGMQTVLIDRRQKQSGLTPQPDLYILNLKEVVEWINTRV